MRVGTLLIVMLWTSLLALVGLAFYTSPKPLDGSASSAAAAAAEATAAVRALRGQPVNAVTVDDCDGGRASEQGHGYGLGITAVVVLTAPPHLTASDVLLSARAVLLYSGTDLSHLIVLLTSDQVFARARARARARTHPYMLAPA